MAKKITFWIIIDLVFLVVFNLLFFLIGGFEHPASVWISYGFIHFAYLMVILTPFITRRSTSSSVFGLSLYSVSAIYFIIELIAGIVFIILRQEKYILSLIIQVIIAGLYIVALVSHLMSNEVSGDRILHREVEIAFVKDASTRVQSLIGLSSATKVNKALERLYDLIHSSPSKSNESAKQLEGEITRMIYDLESAMQSGTLEEGEIDLKIKKLYSAVEERNRKVR